MEGNTCERVSLMCLLITARRPKSLENAYKVAYWDIRLPKRPRSLTEMTPYSGQLSDAEVKLPADAWLRVCLELM